MAASRTYRPVIAGLLLFIYSFIATPVQLWHQHYGSPGYACTNIAKQPVVAADEANASIHHCPVCSHQYTAYDYEGLRIYLSPVSQQPQAQNDHLVIRWQSAESGSLSNKGPPATS